MNTIINIQTGHGGLYFSLFYFLSVAFCVIFILIKVYRLKYILTLGFREYTILKSISIFTLLTFLNLIFGCKNYYQVKPVENISAGHISSLKHYVNPEKDVNNYNYFILHYNDLSWNLNIHEIAQNEITGKVFELPEIHKKYYQISQEYDKPYRYKNKDEIILNDVHMYVNELTITPEDSISFPVSAIQKIDIYEPDVGATTASYIIGFIGGTVAALAIAGVLFALVKESCPYIYVHNGNHFVLQGETFGGAIYSSLERNDYMPLPEIKPVNGQYLLKINNELKEHQFTNIAELLVVNHPEKSGVLADQRGNIYAFSDPELPAKATTTNPYHDHREAFLEKDSHFFLFNQECADSSLNQVTLHFNKPAGATDTAKLILTAKNSFWLDFIYQEFSSMFGNKYNKFTRYRNELPASENLQWMQEQGLLLEVWLKTAEGWKYIDYFNTTGPLAVRDLIMPIDISTVDDNEICIRLRSGFNFWEVDYAAIDFSEGIPPETIILKAKSAIDQDNRNISEKLLNDDQLYLEQPEVGNSALLTFAAPSCKTNMQQSVILHTKGYYIKIRDYKGKPDAAYLINFHRPGAFIQFSKERYHQVCAELGFTEDFANNSN